MDDLGDIFKKAHGEYTAIQKPAPTLSNDQIRQVVALANFARTLSDQGVPVEVAMSWSGGLCLKVGDQSNASNFYMDLKPHPRTERPMFHALVLDRRRDLGREEWGYYDLTSDEDQKRMAGDLAIGHAENQQKQRHEQAVKRTFQDLILSPVAACKN